MIENLDIEEKRIWVQGLLIECPMGTHLDDCPAKELRKIPLKERVNLVKEMTDDQIDQIINYHRACLIRRESF
jgi:hypothetical protein